MKHYWIFVLFIIFLSCRSNKCMSEKKVQKEFVHELKIVKDQFKGKETLVDEYTDALFYLGFLTNTPTRAGYSSTIGYRKESDYKMDIKSWEDWFKKNKCKLTRRYVDSVMKQYNYERQHK